MVTISLAEQPRKNVSQPSNKFVDPLAAKGYYGFYPNEGWQPSVNLYENDTMYIVCVDLSGVEKDKIEIEVTDAGRLTLRGSRPVPTPNEGAPDASQPRIRVHLMEIDHGSFARDVELPQDVRREQIAARYVNGMLWIELPKR